MVLYYGVAWCMYVVLIRPQGRKKEALPTKGSFRTLFHYMDRNFTKYDRVNHVLYIFYYQTPWGQFQLDIFL